MRSVAALLVVAALVSCAPAARPVDTSMKDLVLVSRPGCMFTDQMRANLDAALSTMGRQKDYQFIDLDTLQASDVRRGYPTPTLLYRGRDLFGMPVPAPPFPEPT